MNKIVIIGGGPAGMMAAISSKTHNNNSEVILLEKNNELGRKLKLTGGGRCNVTANVSNEEVIVNVPKNGKFLYSSLNNFNTQDIINFFKDNGLELKEEDHFRMFPITNKSIDIVNTLIRKMEQLKVKIMYDSEVLEINDNEIVTTNGNVSYNNIIIATGGITVPGTGSDGFGHELAKGFGHTITKLVPAEVPLVSNDEFIHNKTLQGLSFKDVEVRIHRPNGKVKKSITHDLLFTHFGISGPAALRASFEVLNLLEDSEVVNITIDFLPKISIGELNNNLVNINGFLKEKELPERLIKYIESVVDNKEDLIKKVKNFEISVYSARGFKHAFVTNGGVNLKEIDPKTFKSKINNKISFCGEVLDINAYTGGFNITSALSSGFTAGKYVEIHEENL